MLPLPRRFESPFLPGGVFLLHRRNRAWTDGAGHGTVSPVVPAPARAGFENISYYDKFRDTASARAYLKCHVDFFYSENRARRIVWSRDSRAAVKRFGYWRDPLCLLSCGLYWLNRGWLKPHFRSPFLHNHFNDLLLIPAALPVLLWMYRRLGLRSHDAPPTILEIAVHTVFWSVLFEYWGPHITPATVGDVWDAVSYGVGAVLAGLWWHRQRWQPATANA